MNRAGPRSPLRSLVSHPILSVGLLIAGVLAGMTVGRYLPVTYTAEARLAVVSATNNAYSIPGYPLAARQLASDYSRWVQNNATGGVWSPAGAVSVSASPIPDSAVIRVEVGARSQEEATRGAEKVSAALVKTVAEAQLEHDPTRAFEDFSRHAPTVALARAETQQAETAYNRAVGARASAAQQRALSTALQASRVKLAELELKQSAAAALYQRLYTDTSGASTLKQIVAAAAVGSPERTALARYGLLGGAVGLFLALLIAVAIDRRRDRRRPGHPAERAEFDDTGDPEAAIATTAVGDRPSDTAESANSRRSHPRSRRAEVDAR